MEPEVKVTWEAPPSGKSSHKLNYNSVFEEVMKNPGNWARIMEDDSSKMHQRATRLRKQSREGELPGSDQGEWEITVRRIPDDESKAGMWVLYKKKEG